MRACMKDVFGYGLALLGFALLFLGVTFNFWYQISLTVALLMAYSAIADKQGMVALFKSERDPWPRAVIWGFLSAAFLYGFFYIGNWMVGLIFPFAPEQIGDIYSLKDEASTWEIALLITIVVGPGEEIFWRGFLQRRLAARHGLAGLMLAIAAYTSVHLASGNFMLIAASAVAGVFWGLMYHRWRSIRMNIVSHLVWDLAIFVFWPIL